MKVMAVYKHQGVGSQECKVTTLREQNNKRAEKWDSEFIFCKNHPERRCNRSDYVNRRHRRCASCKGRRLSGVRIPSRIRWDSSEQRRWRDRSNRRALKIQENKI